MSELTHDEAVKHVASITKQVKFAMLTTTNDAGHLHARPMTTQQTEFDGDVWFIGAKDTESVSDMRARPEVNVSYSDPDKGAYLSIHGTAELVEDAAKLDELWSDAYKAYFSGQDDPNIQLIKISSQGAEFWESGGKVAQLFQLAKGAVTGQHAHHGTNDTVKL